MYLVPLKYNITFQKWKAVHFSKLTYTPISLFIILYYIKGNLKRLRYMVKVINMLYIYMPGQIEMSFDRGVGI